MKQLEKANLPTTAGAFTMYAFGHSEEESMPHIAMVAADIDVSKVVPVRIHSECMTGDVFGSKRCDCGEQLTYSQEYLAQNQGVLLYLRQEGRGIGLVNKLSAYNLQDQGLDTLDANVHLGFGPDERDYAAAISILQDLGIAKINLMTNNPEKLKAFEGSSIRVIDRIPILISPSSENKGYIDTKHERMGHLY